MFDSLRNPRLGNYYGANQLLSRGVDTFTNAVDTYGSRVAKRAENAALMELMGQGIEKGQSGLDYRTSLMGMDKNPDLDAKTGLEAIGLMSSPYIDQGNKDRSYGLDERRVGIAGGHLGVARDRLAETKSHNIAMENKPDKGSKPNFGNYEVVDPITGGSTHFYFDKSNPSKGGKLRTSSVDNGLVDPMGGQSSAIVSDDQYNNGGVDVQQMLAKAEQSPVNVAGSGAPVAGDVKGIPSALPKFEQSGAKEIPNSSAKVSYTKDGFPIYWNEGRAIIPYKNRASKEVKMEDGSTQMVEYNKDTGRDAYGRTVGDAKAQVIKKDNTRNIVLDAKSMDDMIYKQFGEGGYSAAAAMTGKQKQMMFKQFRETGLLPTFKDGGMFGEDTLTFSDGSVIKL